jgi:CBS domain-containing protein
VSRAAVPGAARAVTLVGMTQVSEVMRRDFITVAPEDTLGEVAQKMVDVGTGSAVVRDFGRLIGIVTERDLLKAMAGRVHTSEARVREWMTPDPITATPDTPAEQAAKTMLDNGFRHLPVLDPDGLVVGVVSLRQVAAAELGVESELA